jgi:excisionase family DNA binding protein
MKTNGKRKTITVTEAAVWLGISRQTAYQEVKTGAIPSIRLGRRILVPVHALEAMLAGVGGTTSSAVNQ